MPALKRSMEETSSRFEDVLEDAREEGRREVLKPFRSKIEALLDEIMEVLGESEDEDLEKEEPKAQVVEEEEEEERGGEAPTPPLSKRAQEALEFILARKKVTHRDVQNHLNSSYAATAVALAELERKELILRLELKTGVYTYHPMKRTV